MSRNRNKPADFVPQVGERVQSHTPVEDPLMKTDTTPDIPLKRVVDTNRPVTANGGMGKHRGDRRDMNKAYTNNQKHAARGNNPRVDVSTRKR